MHGIAKKVAPFTVDGKGEAVQLAIVFGTYISFNFQIVRVVQKLMAYYNTPEQYCARQVYLEKNYFAEFDI